MFNLILADLFKLRKSMAIKIILGITTVSSVIMAIMAYLIPLGKIDSSLTGLGFMFSDTNMLSILGAVVAGVFICGDYENKTIHDAITSGNSRIAVIISKAATFFIAITIILLPYAIVTGVALGTGSEFNMGSATIGFLNLLTKDSQTTLTLMKIGKLLVVMLSMVIVIMAQLSICIPLALVLKKPVLVVAINYGVSILSGQLMGLKERFPLFERIFNCTPYGGTYSFLTIESGAGDITKAISISIVYIIGMIVITYLAFRKSEIK
jgi:ABC-2 type transport system permease protein